MLSRIYDTKFKGERCDADMIWLAHTAFIGKCSFDQLRVQNGLEYKLFDQNVLVYGSKGVGKKTYVRKWVERTFPACKWNLTAYPINTDKRYETHLYTRKSFIHTELMFDRSSAHERYWIKHVVRPMCNQLVLSTDGSIGSHYIILYNCHILSTASLTLLRRYLFSYPTCIFILVARQQTRIHQVLHNSIFSIRLTSVVHRAMWLYALVV
jgi:Cdc6-like AAA superfamily ATPase